MCEAAEVDLPEIWPEPLPLVTSVLERCADIAEVYANLPDIQLWAIPKEQSSPHHLTSHNRWQEVRGCLLVPNSLKEVYTSSQIIMDGKQG